ncbi:MAG: cupin domain-containing protein [Alphaproteobacteria bacterium]|nr:MAG: cupin domain-containing protein [Alphaproteobacteria bacterium]
MTKETPARPIAVAAKDIAPRGKASNYPEPFFSRMSGREKRQLGDVFGLTTFGVNLTRLVPGGESALLHRHSKQQEFIYILEGNPTLVTEDAETLLEPGFCAGFTPDGPAHQLVNRSDKDVLYIEIGDRVSGDEGSYPKDDLQAELGADGKWLFTHKDGRPY